MARFGAEQWRRPCTFVAAGVACAGDEAGGAVAADRNLGAPAVHSRLLGVVRRGLVLCHARRNPVEPRCLLRPPAAAQELLPLVGLDWAVSCAACISMQIKKTKKKIIIKAFIL